MYNKENEETEHAFHKCQVQTLSEARVLFYIHSFGKCLLPLVCEHAGVMFYISRLLRYSENRENGFASRNLLLKYDQLSIAFYAGLEWQKPEPKFANKEKD